MRRVLHALAAAALWLLLGSAAGLAQGVNVIGAVTPGNCVSFFSTSQIQDSGSACGGGGGGAVTSVTGTVGQVTVTPTTGAVVVSLPPTITANLTLSGTVNNTGAAQLNGVPLGTFATANFATPPAIGGTSPAAGAFTTLSATGNLTTNVTGSTQCLQVNTSGVVSGTGSACGGGGGTPGGANTNVQFNNSSAFGGDAGFTYAGNGQVTHALGTITTNLKALNITGTWNASGVTFDAPLFMNIVNTASAANSLLVDVQVGGAGVFQISPSGSNTNAFLKVGRLYLGNGLGSDARYISSQASGGNVDFGGTVNINVSGGGVNGLYFTLASTSSTNTDGDTVLSRTGTSILALSNSTTASGLQVFNTTDSRTAPINFERGVFGWTTIANSLTVGTEAGGTGTARALVLISAATAIGIGGSTVSFPGIRNDGGGALGIVTATNSAYAPLTAGLITANGSVTATGNFYLNSNSGLVQIGNAADPSLGRAASNVLEINNGTLHTLTGTYLNWGGQARVTADFSVTSSVALTNVTGLTVNVAAGRTYQFATELYVTDAAAGGVQAAIAGTATATAIQYVGFAIADNAIKAKTNATALATAVASTVTTETAGIIVRITGTITVNAAGTLTVQMAQNTSNATPTIAKRGSWLIVNDMP